MAKLNCNEKVTSLVELFLLFLLLLLLLFSSSAAAAVDCQVSTQCGVILQNSAAAPPSAPSPSPPPHDAVAAKMDIH